WILLKIFLLPAENPGKPQELLAGEPGLGHLKPAFWAKAGALPAAGNGQRVGSATLVPAGRLISGTAHILEGVSKAGQNTEEQASGLVLVDKDQGMTSHDVVGRIRRLAGTRKVGHAGTLD